MNNNSCSTNLSTPDTNDFITAPETAFTVFSDHDGTLQDEGIIALKRMIDAYNSPVKKKRK